ncbi:YciE/YciF ferroxidase family protein [Methylobacterium planeticum]|uniref:Ferritin-like domain-containing protein n=1 Tax=Methylobacterium planeticum TaxID=2615211 RepID=A0A6N6MYX3_9HYPH|nr:ferritin-like domain-containing protein [Methylobacterium planeticum]KAB1075557.1 ferritin-like domain-containing protein [Methylobacterium planeticum]
MGLFTTPIKTMDDLFTHMLQDIYYAEQQITKALPKMIDKAGEPQLKQSFEKHLRETEGQIKRLDQAFEQLGKTAKGVECAAINGIIAETKEMMSDVGDQTVLDAALIAGAQAVEHYEITRYGTIIAYAKQLGHDNVASLLGQTLDEERATDKTLTGLAEASINRKAA